MRVKYSISISKFFHHQNKSKIYVPSHSVFQLNLNKNIFETNILIEATHISKERENKKQSGSKISHTFISIQIQSHRIEF